MCDPTDFHRDAKLLTELVNSLDSGVRWYKEDTKHGEVSETLEADLIAFEMLKEAKRNLATIEREYGDLLGDAMGHRYVTVMDAGTFERNPRREGSTKCVDEEGLWRLVTDTRIVDPDTGEIVPPAEVIRRAYGSESRETKKVRLTGATPSKVEALGIDPDDFFEKAPVVGWNLKLNN